MASGLLKWANLYTRGHDNVVPASDLNSCWGDGLAFCALLHTWFPEKIPMKTLKADTLEDKLSNLALAFRVAEEAGAQPFLDPEDTVEVQDTKSIMVYLNEIYANVNTRPVKFTASAEWVRKWEEKERKAKEEELRRKLEADKAAAAGLEPAPAVKLDGLAAKMAAKRAEEEAKEREEEERLRASGASLLARRNEPNPEEEAEMNRLRQEAKKKMEERRRKAIEEKAAAAEAEAKKRQEMLEKQAALEREVLEKRAKEGVTKIDASDVAYTITGKGAKGGPAKAMLIFTINITVGGKKPTAGIKTDLEALIEGPSEGVRLNIMGGPGGTFHIGFTPNAAGQHWFDFVYLGALLQNKFCLDISDKVGGKVPAFEYTGKVRKEWEAKHAGSSGADAKAEEAKKLLEEANKKSEAAKAAAEEEAKKKAQEEEAKKAEAAKAAASAAAAAEEEARKKAAVEEETRKQAAAEAEAKQKAEAAEKAAQEAAAAEAEAKRVAAEQAAKAAAEEEERRIEEEAKRQIEAEEAAKQQEAAKAAEEAQINAATLEAAEKTAKAEAESAEAAALVAAKELEEAERHETQRLEEAKAESEKADTELKQAEAALSASGDITEDELKVIKEEARQIALGVVADPADDGSAKHASLTTITLTFHAISGFGKELTNGGDTDHFLVSSNGVTSSELTDRGDGSYSFVHKVVPGLNNVDVKFAGAHVPGFPLQFTCPSQDSEIAASKAAAFAKVEAERTTIIKEELERLVSEKKKAKSAIAAEAVEKATQAKAAQAANAQRVAEEAAAQKTAAQTAADKATQNAANARAQHTQATAGIRSMFENKVAQERAETSGLTRVTSTTPSGAAPAKAASGRGRNALANRWAQALQENK